MSHEDMIIFDPTHEDLESLRIRELWSIRELLRCEVVCSHRPYIYIDRREYIPLALIVRCPDRESVIRETRSDDRHLDNTSSRLVL